MSAPTRRPSAGYDWQPAQGDRWDDWDEYEDRRPRGRVGLVSPLRVLLFLVVLIAGGVTFYGLFMEQSAAQLPMSIAGLAMLGISSFLLAISLARAAAQIGRRGRGGKALLAALLGGFFILTAAGATAGAIVLAMLVAL